LGSLCCSGPGLSGDGLVSDYHHGMRSRCFGAPLWPAREAGCVAGLDLWVDVVGFERWCGV